MKHQWLALSHRYQAALQRHLQRGPKSRVEPAHRLGEQAVTLGLETLDVAQIHKAAMNQAMSRATSAAAREQLIRQAGNFFTEVLTPIEKTHRAGMQSAAHLGRKNKALEQRTAQLAAANRNLRRGVTQRKTAEAALRKSGRHYAKLLRESQQLQKHLQSLTHQILSAHETQRKEISRDLQEEIAQTLLGINVRLLTLKKGAAARNEVLAKEIASTQRLVEKSVKTINRFVREFRVKHEA